ncbi:MAG: ParB-like nuclease domain-containing protein [Bryobacterales bacterium]|nr:ParB-like nuclease domain-containing protein [Bryobacterales bacterium]
MHPSYNESPVTRVPVDAIRTDLDTQARTFTSPGAVEDLAEDIERGATLPPLDVFDTGDGDLILVDGFHRLAALRRAGAVEVDVRVHRGDVHEARWYACGANQAHGLRRTNADKRRAVVMALALPQAEGLSDREIARHCGVSHQHVSNIRAEQTKKPECQILTPPPEPDQPELQPKQHPREGKRLEQIRRAHRNRFDSVLGRLNGLARISLDEKGINLGYVLDATPEGVQPADWVKELREVEAAVKVLRRRLEEALRDRG